MQTLDFVLGLHNCLEFSQPHSCLYQAMQTRKSFSNCLNSLVHLQHQGSIKHTQVKQVLQVTALNDSTGHEYLNTFC